MNRLGSIIPENYPEGYVVKIIAFLILFPIASYGQDAYTYGISKVGEILFEHSEMKRDLDEGFNTLKSKTPNYVVKPLEIILPTVMALRDKRFEIKYIRAF